MINENIFDTVETLEFEQAEKRIQNGDILLCSGNKGISSAIKSITHSCFSHVALLLKLPITQQILVLESVESIGVRCVTLKEGYLTNYIGSQQPYDGKILIARHTQMQKMENKLPLLYQRAFSLLGDLYNTGDIAKILERYTLHKIGVNVAGELDATNKFICSEFVYTCFKAIDIDINYDALGFIAPADIANNVDVVPVVQVISHPLT